MLVRANRAYVYGPLNLDGSVEEPFGKVGGGGRDQQRLAAGLKGANEPGDASSLADLLHGIG
jgi:hypothetical protein